MPRETTISSVVKARVVPPALCACCSFGGENGERLASSLWHQPAMVLASYFPFSFPYLTQTHSHTHTLSSPAVAAVAVVILMRMAVVELLSMEKVAPECFKLFTYVLVDILFSVASNHDFVISPGLHEVLKKKKK